jgi:cysteine synthase
MKENHIGHTFKNTDDVLKDTEQPCNHKIQKIKQSVIPKWRSHLATLSADKVTSKQTISDIRTQMQKEAKTVKELVDVILEKNFKKRRG